MVQLLTFHTCLNMIKLCYKEYEYKVTLGACKYFFEQTGKDLQHSLLLFLKSSSENRDLNLLSKLCHFHGILSFEDASILFFALIKQSGGGVSLDEIRDAMYRVSWTPTESEDGLCEPWPVVMLELAHEVSAYFSQIAKKKADI